MKTELVRIGNSRGVRIPKPIIEQCGLGDEVELQIEENRIVISAGRVPRKGWDDAFRAAQPSESDPLLLGLVPANEFDHEEWKW